MTYTDIFADDMGDFGPHRILCGDATNPTIVSAVMGGKKAALLLTSPPYAAQRDYSTKIRNWTELMLATFKACEPHLNYGCQALVVLGPIHKNGEVWEYWKEWLAEMRTIGWRFFDQYPWDKLEAMPGAFGGRLAPAHEFVFHLNRVSSLVNKIIPCKRAGALRSPNDAHLGTRNKDGSISNWTHAGRPAQDRKIPDSVIRLSPQKARGIETRHPAVFPISLPKFLMETFSQPGDLVLDPFVGSGTSLLAAEACGRIAYGIELSEKYCALAQQRWDTT